MVQKDSQRSEWNIPASQYDDLWNLDPDRTAAAEAAAQSQAADAKRFPPRPEKDVIWFIEEYSPTLQDWQRDILSMLRDEMLYF
jgi:stage V sporulation protein R